MIQEARIGIGISGKEGLQAARSADFSISQFRFLPKLLLVHGAWGYHRISKAAVFCVYKNILLYASQIWFAFVSLFSGQTVFESWMIGLYNVVFTAWPPIILGLTEQFVTAPYLLAHPSLYRFGQKNSFVRFRDPITVENRRTNDIISRTCSIILGRFGSRPSMGFGHRSWRSWWPPQSWPLA